ncbi:Kiwellin [Hibiscus syriacus]|uniref:Kiwellin n=1 Tax=Hibiscus syriacus TaxID=106335 RepID=A0A6A2WMF6_HIBSY|nr:putative ripening-related protein 1 [Hibiscus syriacus]KAE8660471.1 Kiwellin [Hibiscus syriacus]
MIITIIFDFERVQFLEKQEVEDEHSYCFNYLPSHHHKSVYSSSRRLCLPFQWRGQAPPPGKCNEVNSSASCAAGQAYDLYDCSSPVSRHTKANLTLQSFDHAGDEGQPAECDLKYHDDDELIVALSTGWFDHKGRCSKFINIRDSGRRVRAKVVDECVSSGGCDDAHDYEPPCGNTIVRASKAVWSALGVPDTQWNRLDIHWSDAYHIYVGVHHLYHAD